MSDTSQKSRVLTLVFTNFADSAALKTEGGGGDLGDLIARHCGHPRFKDLLRRMSFPER